MSLMAVRVLSLFAFLVNLIFAGPTIDPEPKYLGEIGHLNSAIDSRKIIHVGGIAIHWLAGDKVQLQGRSEHGHVWSTVLPTIGGLGWTTLWSADFDRNSRSDLLLLRSFPSVGRCPQTVEASFLMSDSNGPKRWDTVTTIKYEEQLSGLPVFLFEDLRNRRFTWVSKACEYAERNDVTLSVPGVFQAGPTGWDRVPASEMTRLIQMADR
jgi:hypothetical protein